VLVTPQNGVRQGTCRITQTVKNPKVDSSGVSRAPWRVSRADQPNAPDIEQAAAMAVHMHGYGDQHFRRV
jgi:hypothetical protein